MKNYLFSLMLLFCLSCSKDEPVAIIDHSWKEFAEIKHQAKNASDCSVHNDVMVIRGLSSLSYITSQHQLQHQYILSSNLSYGYKPFPATSGFYVTLSDEYNPSRIECRPFLNLTNATVFDFHQDSTLVGLERLMGLHEPVYLASPSGQFVFKVKSSVHQPNALLVLVDINHPANFRKIPLTAKPAYTFLHFYSSGKYYYSSTDLDEGLFTLDTLGNTEKISNQGFVSVTESNGVFYAVNAFNGLFISVDKGRTWRASSINAPSGKIVDLNHKPFFLDSDRIVELIVKNDEIKLVPYFSKGLEGNSITALCAFNGRYYCTTKSGVFYLNEQDFLPE